MTYEEIVGKINSQLYVAIALQVMATCTKRFDPLNQTRIYHLHNTAKLFTNHALKLLAANRLAAARWLDARLPEPKWTSTIQ